MNRNGKSALVIGASSGGGLGEAVARRLHDAGFAVLVAGRRMDPLRALAKALDGRALACDVTDEASIEAMFVQAGPVDVLVNAAGTTDASRLSKITREQIESQFAMHVTANMLLLKHATANMVRGGAIILFSSLTAAVPGEGLAAYSCAKAALDHLVRIAALEFGSSGIRVNAVAPGFSPTPMTEGIFAQPAIRDLYLNACPLGSLAVSPEQVASAVAWLAQDDCFANGDTIQLSGGAHLGRLPHLNEIRHARRM